MSQSIKGLCMICRKDNVELSDEHIIPDAIGGAMHSYQVCKKCNSMLGQEIDPLLTNHKLIELIRFSKRIKGKTGKIPNPLGGNLTGEDDAKYLVLDNDGKLNPCLIPDVSVDVSNGQVKLVLDARDKPKAQSMLDKICDRNGWQKHQLTEQELEIKTAPLPKFSIPIAIDLQQFKLPLLKIAYEFCVETISGYIDDPLAVIISSVIYNKNFDEMKKLAMVGNGFTNPFEKIFDQFIDNQNGNRHVIIVMNIDNSLYCSVSVFNALSIVFKMSNDAYLMEGHGIIAINDILKHAVEKMSLEDFVASRQSNINTEIVLRGDKRCDVSLFYANNNGTIVYNANGYVVGYLTDLLLTIPQIDIRDDYENQNNFVVTYDINASWYLRRYSDLRLVKIYQIRSISEIQRK